MGRIIEVKANTTNEIKKSKELYQTSLLQLKQYLYDINNNQRQENREELASTLEIFAWFVAKEKAIYNALNMMKTRSTTYIGFLWAPIEKEQLIQGTINQFPSTEFRQLKRNEDEAHIIPPPTYFKSNDVTAVFQLITNTYGVPLYHEVNPTVFGIITFPFLFGVMFGDYGHGSLLFSVGAFLVLFADKLKGGALEGALPLRYLLIMMGFFSSYNGLLYNEWFAIYADWFGTCFADDFRTCTTNSASPANCNAVFLPQNCTMEQFNEDGILGTGGCVQDCVYGFGLDPAWGLSPNLLTYTNNIKMKTSVCIGIIHMTIGIVCKGLNAVYFKQYIVLIFEVITGLIILLGLFGWMDLLIVAKWNYIMNPYSQEFAMQNIIAYAPSIITVMINNFLAGGNPGVN